MTECIEHSQKGTAQGYGSTSINGRSYMLHRAVYAKFNNLKLAALTGLVVRHNCDNPRCINPKHLSIGTQQDNINDKVRRNRQAKGEVHGRAVLTAQDVHFIRKHYKPRCKLYSGAALARQFNTSSANISRIILHQIW